MNEQLPIDYSRIAISAPLGELTEEERLILVLLRMHRGKENAISMADLAGAMGICTRTLQQRIKHLIEEHGVLIGSATGDPHGYYLITDPKEVEASVDQLRHRAISLFKRIARIQKSSVEEIFNQMRMEI